MKEKQLGWSLKLRYFELAMALFMGLGLGGLFWFASSQMKGYLAHPIEMLGAESLADDLRVWTRTIFRLFALILMLVGYMYYVMVRDIILIRRWRKKQECVKGGTS